MASGGNIAQQGGTVASWVFSSMAEFNSGLRSVVDSLWQWGQGFSFVPMDTLHTLLLGWLVFGVLIVFFAKFLYDKFLSGDSDIPEDEYSQIHEDDERSGPKLPEGGCFSSPPKVSRKPTIVPDGPAERASPPVATGGDPDAVRWINNLLVWFYEGSQGGPILRDTWNDALNEYTVGSALETGVLVEIMEFFPQTPAPRLSNIIVDCSPTDDMDITCDMEHILYLRVQTTRTQREVTTESEYACAVRPLRGRLNIAIQTLKCAGRAKLVGWPEVCMELEGIRNNTEGRDEEQLQEVVREVVTGALRQVCLNLHFFENKNFPRFSRARSLPDHVIPVGYDALVREAQTHPPSFIPKTPTSHIPLPPAKSSVRDVNAIRSAMGIPPATPYKTSDPKSKPTIYINPSKGAKSSPSVPVPVTIASSTLLPPMSDISSEKSSVSDEEHVEEAGESFSAMSYTNHERLTSEGEPQPHIKSPLSKNGSLSPHATLTESEESLIARNLEKYDRSNSIPDIDLPKLLAKYTQDVGESMIIENAAAKKVEIVSKETVQSKTSDKPIGNQSLVVFSSREKPIDEYGVNESYTDEDDEEAFEELKRFAAELPSIKETPKKMGIERRSRSPFKESPPNKSPRDSIHRDMDVIKESLRNNPYGQHLPLGGMSSFSQSAAVPAATPVGIIGLNGKRLLVKVVKATGIGGSSAVKLSYAVVEMDEPAQKFTTAAVNDSNSPFWDEQFLFDLTDNTLELLFEIYDKSDNRFLGLGIVGIEELVATPSQRQIIPLQSRPYENDQVTGSLTCEFLFLDRADLPDLTLRPGSSTTTQLVNNVRTSVKTTTSPTASSTTTTYMKPEDGGVSDESVRPGLDVASVALRDLEERHSASQSPPVPSTKSTMIIHASRRVIRTPSGEYAELINGLPKPMEDPRYETPAGISGPQKPLVGPSYLPSVPIVTTSPSSSGPHSLSFSTTHSTAAATSIPEPSHKEVAVDTLDRGRTRIRQKRDFFGSLRRRFSRSRIRSKSVDPTSVAIDKSYEQDSAVGRAASAERSTSMLRSRADGVATNSIDTSSDQRYLSVPGRGRTSAGGLGGDTGSTRSSLSGTSGLSSTSTKTYINEASLLVVETLENGIIKHYLVPLSLQRKNKWRKKGTKLHIYNEHTFVAKHISSSILCQVCNKNLARRLGKQGYECRDCSFKCHKPCHVKIEAVCPNSTVNSMDLVYVKDEKSDRKTRSS